MHIRPHWLALLLFTACDPGDDASSDAGSSSGGSTGDSGDSADVTPRFGCLVAPPFANGCPENRKLTVVEHASIHTEIPDNAYNGTQSSMLCLDLVVPNDPISFIERVEVSVGIRHTYVGDLVVRLFSPAGRVVTLVNRPGLAGYPDTGVPCCGDDSNLTETRPLVLRDSATTPAEAMGTMQPSSATICVEDEYAACVWQPAPDGAMGTALADYDGNLAAGTWKLCVGDSGISDLGRVFSAKLTIQRIRYDPNL